MASAGGASALPHRALLLEPLAKVGARGEDFPRRASSLRDDIQTLRGGVARDDILERRVGERFCAANKAQLRANVAGLKDDHVRCGRRSGVSSTNLVDSHDRRLPCVHSLGTLTDVQLCPAAKVLVPRDDGAEHLCRWRVDRQLA